MSGRQAIFLQQLTEFQHLAFGLDKRERCIRQSSSNDAGELRRTFLLLKNGFFARACSDVS